MRQLIEAARTLDWRPLWISLKTGVLATAVCFVLGILAAWRVMYCRGKHRSVLDAVLTLPMVLPPTVAGFFLLLFFSRRRPLGIFLFDHFGIKIVQSQAGCVIAASVIAFPLMYRSARAAFEQVDINLLYAGRTLGMSDPEIFFKVILPCARGSRAERCWLSPVRSGNTAPHPCWPAISREKRRPFRRGSQWSFRIRIT